MLQEVGFPPECQVASGVNAIGPDHHVNVASSSPVEDHVDTTVVQGIWVIISSKRNSASLRPGLDQDRAEVCPRQLNLTIYSLPTPHARYASTASRRPPTRPV
jgi:hypothetical protein